MRRAATIGLVLAALGATACTSDDGGPQASTTTVDLGPAPASWPTAGADLANSRSVQGGELRSDTIDGLRAHWRTEIDTLQGLSTVPIVVDGTVFVAGASGQVAALDATTGDTEWLSTPSGFNIG